MFIKNKYNKWYYQIIQRATNRKLEGYVETHHIIPKSLAGSNDTTNLVTLTAREHFICHLLLVKMTEGEFKAKMIHALSMMIANNKNQQRQYKITSRIFDKLKNDLSKIMKEKWTYDKRKEISERMSGENNPFFGKNHTFETKEKLSNRIISDQTKELISISQKERFKTEAGTFLGRKHSDATRQKMSKSASKPKSNAWKESASKNRKGKIAPNKGIPHRGSTKQKISESLRGEKNGFYGKQHSPEQREKKRQEKLAAPKKLCYNCKKEFDPMNYRRWHGDKCKHRK